jgi:hypothetical protein
VRFLIGHTRHGAQGERPGGCGKEEVLWHDHIVFDITIPYSMLL